MDLEFEELKKYALLKWEYIAKTGIDLDYYNPKDDELLTPEDISVIGSFRFECSFCSVYHGGTSVRIGNKSLFASGCSACPLFKNDLCGHRSSLYQEIDDINHPKRNPAVSKDQRIKEVKEKASVFVQRLKDL